MAKYETVDSRLARQAWAKTRYQEATFATPDEIMQVDSVREAKGELPSRFGRDMTRMAAAMTTFRDVDRQVTADRRESLTATRDRALNTAVEQYGRLSSQMRRAQSWRSQLEREEAAAGPMGLDLSGPYAGQVVPTGQGGGGLSLGGIVRPIASRAGEVVQAFADPVGFAQDIEYAGDPEGRKAAEAEYQQLQARAQGMYGVNLLESSYEGDNPLLREAARPINYIPGLNVARGLSFAPRASAPVRIGAEILGAAAGVAAGDEVTDRTGNPYLGVAAGLATGVGAGAAAGRLGGAVEGALRNTDDLTEGAIRAAEGPLDASTMGRLREGATPGAVDPVIPGVTPRGRANIRGATDVAESPSVRRYVEQQARAEEPVRTGIVEALGRASAAVDTDPQGMVSRLAGNVPGLRNVRNWDRPGLEMKRNILEGHIAKRGVESQLLTDQGPRRYEAIRAIDDVFGEGSSGGSRVLDDVRVNVDELHKAGGKEYPASGTVFDALQRPYAYNLTDEQTQAIRAWADADEGLRVRLNEEYGAEVGKFVPERGGVYVQNINKSEARQAQLEELARQEARTISGSGQSKTRVYESGFDRWKNNVGRGLDPDRVFVPETDLNILGYTGDLSKANAAGDLTFRAAVGGKTISEVKEEISPALTRLRDQLRTDVQSIRGRINRAEQSMRRDSTVASRLETQANQTARRADELAGREPIEQFETAIAELDRRAAALSQAASGPAGRADLARQGIESLRDDLASLKDQYADVKRAYDAVDPQDFVQSKSIPGRYFPTKEAVQIDELARPAKDNVITRTLEGWRSQVLAGDVGPLTGIQGLILAASGRAGVTRAVVGSLADAVKNGDALTAFRAETMQQFLRENADLVDEFAFYTGRNVGGRLPAEIGQGGLLAKIPGFTDANEAMFNVVTRRQIEMFGRIRDDLVKAGYSAEEAAAAAGDLSSKVVPLMTTSRLGQSAAKAQEQRFAPTSLGFIRQPLALTEEAFETMGRMATGQTVTPRQKLAVSIYTQFIGNLMALGVTSAAINAIATGDDVQDAITDALDSGSRAFMALSIGDKRLPMANPFRSPLRVGLNKLRNTLNLGVEPVTGKDISADAGSSAVNYVTGRIGPPLRAGIEATNELTAAPWERKYQGDNDILRLLSAGAMLATGAAPIPAQGIAEEAKSQYDEGEFKPLDLFATAAAETASFSLIPQEERKQLDSKAQQAFGSPFSELDRQQRRMVLLANPDLSDVARDDVRERMEESGYKSAEERAWSEMAPEFGVKASTYKEYRDGLRAELEGEGLERSTVDALLREDPLSQAYNDLRRGFEFEWIAENADGMSVEAYDFGLIPDNEPIRQMLGVAK